MAIRYAEQTSVYIYPPSGEAHLSLLFPTWDLGGKALIRAIEGEERAAACLGSPG